MARSTVREIAAEFLGTFVLIVFGCAVVAQVVLSEKDAGQYLSINIGWGLAVTMGVYVAGGISGAHLNPAVTVAMACLRGFSWAKVIPYIIAQLVGAFAASAVVYLVYFEALNAFDGGVRTLETAGIWATYPQDYLSSFPGGFIDQVVGTALLLMLIFALTDQRNNAPEAKIGPLLIGAVVLLIGMTYGVNAGYAINPARDFGPRLFTYFAGWGEQVFAARTMGEYWWWVPIAGPLVGGVLGGVIYDVFITRFYPKSEDSTGEPGVLERNA